jgi:hypothetical protein
VGVHGHTVLARITGIAATTTPRTSEMRYPGMLWTAKITKMPPCGARTPTLQASERPPVTSLPSMMHGITRRGSAAANGMAPSVMNDAPSSHPALPFSRLATLNRPGRSTVASASAGGSVAR